MGHRNPFRIQVDQETGWLYNGEVGPDANADNANRGPRGYDELNQIREAGNMGWPYCIADNKAYRDYDFEKPRLLLESAFTSEFAPDLEDYDYPGRFTDRIRGKHLAKRSLERLRADYELAEGLSDAYLALRRQMSA